MRDKMNEIILACTKIGIIPSQNGTVKVIKISCKNFFRAKLFGRSKKMVSLKEYSNYILNMNLIERHTFF